MKSQPSVWKGLLAGTVAGLGASWAMNQFQAALSAVASSGGDGQSDENATTEAADAIARRTLDRDLTRTEKQSAGSAIHYAFGATMGALYGAAAELAPAATTAAGVAFGTGLWLVADEIAVPALNLSKAPLEYPASTHISALAAHVVYGVTADVLRRAVRLLV